MILNRTELDILDRNRSYSLLTTKDVANGKSTNWPELEIAGTIRNLSPSVWKLTHLTALYLNDNCLKSLPPSISLLSNLRRLDLANNKLGSLPPEIGELTELRECNLANNLLRSLPYEMGRLFQLHFLGLKGNQLGPEYTSFYNKHNGTRELLDHMLDSMTYNLPPPPPRPWLSMVQVDANRPSAVFSVMCFNVLCDRYATREKYGYCPIWALSWDYRKKQIIGEVQAYGADIITLQEVEMEQFYNFFLRELKNDGYEGIFSPKSRAKTMTDVERKRVDGCAIFYKTSKFTMVKEHLIEFNQLAMSMSQDNMNLQSNRNLLNRVMPKDNIALSALLETKETVWDSSCTPSDPVQVRQQILVCTAHIHWDPDFCDVKLIQSMMLADQLKRLIEECTTPKNPSIQLLLCGDLNSLPDSGVVEFLSEGKISTSHLDFKNFDYMTTLTKMLNHSPNKEYYTHAFKLASAIPPSIMPFTNYTYDFKGIIDYIFYPKATMQVSGVLGPVDENYLKEHKVVGCPQPHMASDHFPLLVEFVLPMPLGSAESNPLPMSHSTSQHGGGGSISPHRGPPPMGSNNTFSMLGLGMGMGGGGPPPPNMQGPPPGPNSGNGPFGMPSLMNYPPPNSKNSSSMSQGFLR